MIAIAAEVFVYHVDGLLGNEAVPQREVHGQISVPSFPW